MITLPFARPINAPFDPTQGWYAKRVSTGLPHQGMDFAAPVKSPVYAIAPGIVTGVGDNHPDAGTYVVVEHTGPYAGLRSRYLHLHKRFLNKNAKVGINQQLGLSGGKPGAYGAGRSDAPHLHLDIQAMKELLPLLKKSGLKTVGRANGPGYNVPVESFIVGTGDPTKWAQLGVPYQGEGGAVLATLAAAALLFV